MFFSTKTRFERHKSHFNRTALKTTRIHPPAITKAFAWIIKKFFHQSVGHERFMSPGWTMRARRKFPLCLLFSLPSSEVRFLKRFSNFDLRFGSLWLRVESSSLVKTSVVHVRLWKTALFALRINKLLKDRFSVAGKLFFRATFTFLSADSWFCADRGSFLRASWDKRRTLIGRLSFHSAFFALRWW